MNYDDACKAATTRQGLDPVIAALDAAGVRFTVEQTGGFCMVVTVPAPDGTYALTVDTPGLVLRGFFPGDAWQETGESLSDDDLDPERFAAWVAAMAAPVQVCPDCQSANVLDTGEADGMLDCGDCGAAWVPTS